MQRETSNDSFLEYGQTYHEPIRLTHPDLIHQHQTAITRRYVSQFYCFNCDTYIEVHDGIGVLLVSHTADAADVQEFAMNRLIHIKPNVYFAVVSTTQKLEFELYMPRATILSMLPISLPSMSSLRFCPVLKCRRSWGIIIESAPRTTASRVSSITFLS